MEYCGNIDILAIADKVGYLCSRKYTAKTVVHSYDWAIAQKAAQRCVVSGFHSPIEQDILTFLLNGNQPIVAVLARRLYKQMPPKWTQAIEAGRLLVVSPFDTPPIRPTQHTAYQRNVWILQHTSSLAVGYASAQGQLASLLATYANPIHYLTQQPI